MARIKCVRLPHSARRGTTWRVILIKRGLILALAIAAITAVLGASVAEAHVLPAKTAKKAAKRFGKKVGQLYIEAHPDRAADANYLVDPCSRKTDHRFVCKLHVFRMDSDMGPDYDCHAFIIVQASKSKYTYTTKLTGRKAC